MFNLFNKKPKKTRRVKSFAEPVRNSLTKEIARREDLDFTSTFGYLPDPDEILLKTGNTFDVYRSLMLDSQVRACVSSRKAGTKSLLWELIKGDNPESKVNKLIQDFYNSIDIDCINDAILNAPYFGFQPIEIIWAKSAGYILPKDLIPKNPEWFVWDNDSNLRLLTNGNSLIGEELPDKKFLTPTFNDINNNYYNPYGDRLLSSCFWPVTFKKSSFKWWVTFGEKYGIPYLVGKMPNSQIDQKDDMIEQLQNMVMDAVAVVSEDSQIDIVGASSGHNNAKVFQDLINLCDEAISKALLGQTLSTDSGNGSGSYALGKVHASVREDIVLSDKKIVENTHNKLIRWIVELNFGANVECPKFVMYNEEDVDLTLAQRDEILAKSGVSFTKDYFIKAYGFEKNDINVNDNNDDIKPDSEFSEFVESKNNAIDALMSKFTDKLLQDQIQGALKPVFEAIDNAKDFKEVSEMLDKIKPEMTSLEIEDQLTNILFISSLLGRQDAKDDLLK